MGLSLLPALLVFGALAYALVRSIQERFVLGILVGIARPIIAAVYLIVQTTHPEGGPASSLFSPLNIASFTVSVLSFVTLIVAFVGQRHPSRPHPTRRVFVAWLIVCAMDVIVFTLAAAFMLLLGLAAGYPR